MTTINLSWTTTKRPDFSGFAFYVESGRMFDAGDFAESYNLNRYDIKPDHAHSVQDAAAQLGAGEWLCVEFELAEEVEDVDQNSLLADTEAMIAAARHDMDDESKTARAIDRNDAWEVVVEAARLDGLNEQADALEEAADYWEA